MSLATFLGVPCVLLIALWSGCTPPASMFVASNIGGRGVWLCYLCARQAASELRLRSSVLNLLLDDQSAACVTRIPSLKASRYLPTLLLSRAAPLVTSFSRRRRRRTHREGLKKNDAIEKRKRQQHVEAEG